ncbi:helix-turn-helix domain-containing protein [Streptomyces sp. ET3-23]|nr:helix-turn-helix transcriptional regulator [Streptomyces sp. ET3-23]MCC2276976.1 helix-turn-helix domain-containing protein [Streptomyces sp. ET3-23]
MRLAHPTDEDADQGAADLFRVLGRQVKALRERAGLTQRELGRRLGYGEETIASVEQGRRVPQPAMLIAADEELDAGGVLTAAADAVERAKKTRILHPAWFRGYAQLEAEAVELHSYCNHVIPGLLQTEDYARALFGMRTPLLDEQTIDMRVTARLARQELLTRWPAPIVTYVVEESALHRPIGGREVRRRQLEQLLSLGKLRSVELQVMPTDRSEHAGMGGPFTLLTPKGQLQVAHVEVQHVNRLIIEHEEVRMLAARYSSLRAQALPPGDSLNLVEKLLGDT